MLSILLTDDDPDFRNLVKAKLANNNGNEEYDLSFASSGEETLKILSEKHIEIILADINMPEMDGLTLLNKIHEFDKSIKVIMISADGNLKNIRVAMNREAFDFLTKPIDFYDLELTIKKAIKQIEIEKGFQTEIELGYEKLKKAIGQIIQSVASMEEMRDPYTAGHMKRVAALAKALAINLGLEKDTVEGIYMAASLHDIGKICVPTEILSKPGRLSCHEFDLIQDHADAGYEILKNIEFPWPIAEAVRQHHEKLDGSGYPRGLKDKEILFSAKIITVSDVVESVASFRPYRPALGIDEALKVISKGKGIHFDPTIVESCLELFLEKDFEFSFD